MSAIAHSNEYVTTQREVKDTQKVFKKMVKLFKKLPERQKLIFFKMLDEDMKPYFLEFLSL